MADYELVQVSRLLGCEAMKAQVIDDEQVRGEERAEGAIHGVVHAGLGHGPEEVVGVDEAGGVSGDNGGVAEGLSQEALAYPGWTHR